MKQPEMNKTKYFRVVTTEREESADLYLYGYIGQDFWYDDEMKDQNLTDIDVVQKIKELERKYSRINVRINSPGGSVYHGDPIITALRSSTAEVHTYVDGMAASMAADIWIAGKVRHMSANSKLMIHSTSSFCWGTAKDMLDAADMLDKFDDAAIAAFSSATDMSEEEIRLKFYDYRDHWLTANEVKDLGLIESVESYESPSNIDDVERMSYAELLLKSITSDKKQDTSSACDDVEIENEIFILINQ